MSTIRKLLPIILFGFALAYLVPQMAAQTPNRAALIVRHGDGSVQTSCVEFTEAQITGYDLLQRSGLAIEADVQGMGALICSIGGEGCPSSNCLCQCSGGGNCEYWSYWHQLGGSWQYSQAGAGVYPIMDGAVDGWSWGPGSVNNAVAPPALTFADVCQAAIPDTPTPTNTAVPPTLTPTPQPTATFAPEINFTLDTNMVNAGSCTTLRWQVEHITAVYLNEVGVEGHGTQEICPVQTETYTLKVVHPAGENVQTLTVNVVSAAATMAVPTATQGAQNVVAAANVTAIDTAVPPTNTPVPTTILVDTPAQPTITPAVAASPTAASTEIVWMSAPTLPSATFVAALPATPAPTVAVVDEGVGEDTAVNWLSYLVFLIIVFILGALIWRANRHANIS